MTDLLLVAGVAAAVFVLAAMAQAITGFGSALVAVPLLTLVVHPIAAVVAATAVSLVLTSGAAWRERSYVDLASARTLTLTGVLGMPLGLVLLALADESRLQAWIAGSMLVMVLLVAAGVRIGARGLPVAGLLSGALLTSTGMNGPPLVMALMDRERRGYRATLQGVFAVQDVVAVAAFLVLGYVDREVALLIASGVVGLPAGWRLGDAVFHRIPAARLRPVIVGGLVLTAASVLLAAVT
ncbi:sulfite exporter TauE/SafE family protein [Nocardioides sp.]|uniref:sulfite exporter TauE/SafE family protein n=1 Tax=Nocardioides sp. TaxID=35761 RepID=UPI0026083A01|nr:sulfite exporter TauE/SafE family protein [Nocardioides sp.]MDI6908213.1 sulfite exporter TauE/SafE family protein [Nocardioides sp.]